MKKILVLLAASVLGGAVSVAIYSNMAQKEIRYVQNDSTLQGARPLQVN